MARAGTWELRHVVLRYSLNAGSSRGVREFVKDGLVEFAAENPQISIKTMLRDAHPFVYGRYINDYERQIGLKNQDSAEVLRVFQYLRNTLGHKSPSQNEVSAGNFETKVPTVQGYWTTPKTLYSNYTTPINAIENIDRPTMQEVINRVGYYGAARVMDRLEEYRRPKPSE